MQTDMQIVSREQRNEITQSIHEIAPSQRFRSSLMPALPQKRFVLAVVFEDFLLRFLPPALS